MRSLLRAMSTMTGCGAPPTAARRWVQVGNSTATGGRASFQWLHPDSEPHDPCPATDVVVDPNNSNRVYAAINFVNVFTSSDGGSTWSEAQFPGIKTGTDESKSGARTWR